MCVCLYVHIYTRTHVCVYTYMCILSDEWLSSMLMLPSYLATEKTQIHLSNISPTISNIFKNKAKDTSVSQIYAGSV